MNGRQSCFCKDEDEGMAVVFTLVPANAFYVLLGLIDGYRPTHYVAAWTFGIQAFKALGSQAKASMRANKLLREEMALQEVGENPWRYTDSAKKSHGRITHPGEHLRPN